MTKTFKQIREIDVPKGHEYGPSSRKRPAGKAGYTSSDSARTTHLKTVKKWSKKKRRQGDKEFANEAPEHPRNIRFWDSRAKQVAIDTIKNPNKIIAVELIVIEIDTLSRGISFNKILISSIVQIGTPTFPISPWARLWLES